MAPEPKQVDAINTAYEWHGGQSSVFYRFASNHKVDDEEHREELFDEIAHCKLLARENATKDGYDADVEIARLENLRQVVATAEIGKELMTYREWADASP